MMRYVAFLVPGSAFVTGIMTTVQTHRVAAEPKVLFTSTPVNYVDDHWPSSLPANVRARFPLGLSRPWHSRCRNATSELTILTFPILAAQSSLHSQTCASAKLNS